MPPMSMTRRGFLGASMTAALYSRVLGANDRVQVGFIGYGLIGTAGRQFAPQIAKIYAEIRSGKIANIPNTVK